MKVMKVIEGYANRYGYLEEKYIEIFDTLDHALENRREDVLGEPFFIHHEYEVEE